MNIEKIRQGVEEYLTIRQSLGFRLDHPKRMLRNFVSFLEQEDSSYISTDLIVKWANLPKNTQLFTRAARFSIIRKFIEYWHNFDSSAEVPPKDLLIYSYRRKPPYIYTDEEVSRLLLACKKLTSKIGLRKHTYQVFFGLIACTGLRRSEVIILDKEHIDFDRSIITIKNSKFNRSRMVPIHSTVLKHLIEYNQHRDQLFPILKTNAFFVSEKGLRLNRSAIRDTFLEISQIIGIRNQSDRCGPRIHDLRHRFAVKTIIKWYKSGINVDQRMPILSTYLGHIDPRYTYWYLSNIPELMNLALSRLSGVLGAAK
jgi:integrase